MILRLFFVMICSVIGSTLSAQQGKLDSTFNILDDGLTGDGFDNAVRTLLLQPDGRLIVGGDYLNFNGKPRPYICRLQTDGTVDASFETGTGLNGKVYSSFLQPDGKILLGGNFTTYNGIAAGRLIRLNQDGSYDASFTTTVGASSGIIHQIARQSDGKLLVAGTFINYNGVKVNRIARLLQDGSLDSEFATGTGSAYTINALQIQPDGKIIVAGNFDVFNGTETNRIVRLQTDGTVDPSFSIGSGFNADCTAVFLQNDGKILIGGSFTQFNGKSANRLVRLNADGTLDESFLSGSAFSNGIVYAIKTDSSGNIMVGGSFSDLYNEGEVKRLVFLNADGSAKTDFDIGSGPASASVLALSDLPDGSWLIGGSFSVFDSKNQGRLAKIIESGEHDIPYLAAGVGFNNSVVQLVPQTDSKIIVAGNFTKFNEMPVSRIARISSIGDLDTSFNTGQTGANNMIKTIAAQSDGKMILGGSFTLYNGATHNRIVRILPGGEIDPAFISAEGCNGQVFVVAVQSDQKILVAGNFTKYKGVTVGRIFRLRPDGNLDTDFNAGLGADATIEAMIIQPDGKILLGGRFNSFNGVSKSRIVRLNSNGEIDSGFLTGTGFDKNIYSLSLQSDEKIIAGGSFLSYNGTAKRRIIRLHSNGQIDTSFDVGTGFSNGEVRSILIQPDNRILAGGTFSGNYNGTAVARLIRLDSNGFHDASFSVNLNSTLFAMQFASRTKLVIGGNFNSVSGTAKHRIAVVHLCTNSSVWNGTVWSNGYPSEGKELFFKEDYTFAGSASGCSCIIAPEKEVTVVSGKTLSLDLDYAGNGTLILENSATLYQSDDAIVNSGIIHLKRNTSPVVKFDYTYWSSPVEDQKLIDLSPKTLSDKFFSYDFDSKSWYGELPATSMTIGRGYIIRGPQDFSATIPAVFEATFKGTPVNGKVAVPIGNADSYNLVGNPYPSAIDADTFLQANQEIIKSTIYFWTHNTPITNSKYNQNDYAVYNLLGGVGTRPALASGINETVPDGAIGSGQSFFVQSLTAGELKFDNTMRSKDNNTLFFKPGKKQNISKNTRGEKSRIWLNMSHENEIFKQILIGYAEGATDGFDPAFDGEVFNANKELSFYSRNDGKNWSIQGKALPFKENAVIELGYSTLVAGDFQVSIDQVDGVFENQSVFLEDKKEKIWHNLKEAAYHFTTETGTYNERFQLRFTDANLHYDNNELAHDDYVTIYQHQEKVNIAASAEIQSTKIYNLLGQLILEDETKTNHLVLDHFKPQNQILVLRVTVDQDKVITRKIFF
jgi:uncharacterized delta-60 repeat protein